MYAISEEEKGKFEKSVYAWRSLRSGILGHAALWHVYAIFKMMKGFLHSNVYERRAGVRHHGGLASIRYF